MRNICFLSRVLLCATDLGAPLPASQITQIVLLTMHCLIELFCNVKMYEDTLSEATMRSGWNLHFACSIYLIISSRQIRFERASILHIFTFVGWRCASAKSSCTFTVADPNLERTQKIWCSPVFSTTRRQTTRNPIAMRRIQIYVLNVALWNR